ncbi:MAG: T9SS type A sorting domain-containing protein [Paludibacteraceae bacterium]|nr:T9SS type A sorting domain-containing protein [Paludibacteraceae bacterium]MBQ9100493.1 T9SS type A sorting domain-containing protein [Paludibacteraceae bacterium]
MKTKHIITIILCMVGTTFLSAAETILISIDGNATPHKISRYIYGKNNSTNDDSTKATTDSMWTLINESGIGILRENSGNNLTKYNFHRRVASHPDWYNRVHDQNWDYEIQTIQENAPQVQVMYGLPILGWVGANSEYNFKDWDWYISHGNKWLNTAQNVTGKGAEPNPDNGKNALVDGDISTYLKEWPTDSCVGILDHWFGENGLGIDRSKTLYWALDNEPEIWHLTHDDVQKEPVKPEEYIEKYVRVAKAARAKYPDLKLIGPICANEWQWFAGPDRKDLTIDGRYWPWLEYIIKRIAEEEKKCGMKLLDVFALHYYPINFSDEEILQTHRIYFDENYIYPKANGVKLINGGWDETQSKVYIFKRCQEWMKEYMGEDDIRALGITETGIESNDPDINSVWYGSMMGEFMKHNLEFFIPWSWKTGMWETLHLFARYNKEYYLPSTSENDSIVSVHTSISADKDSMSILLINRSIKDEIETEIQLKNYEVPDGEYRLSQLSDLPEEETFISHAINALKEKSVMVQNGKATITLPPLSTSTLQLCKTEQTELHEQKNPILRVYPTYAMSCLYVEGLNEKATIQLISTDGKVVLKKETQQTNEKIDISNLPSGYYLCAVTMNDVTKTVQIVKK